ncbi:hypothetical protein D3C81_1610250 [compost metagenome]
MFKNGYFVEFFRAEYPSVFREIAVAVALELLVHGGERKQSFRNIREGIIGMLILEFLENFKLISADNLNGGFRKAIARRPQDVPA